MYCLESALSEITSSPVGLRALFWAFLRLGLTAFGGPSMVAYIRKLAVERKRWLDSGTFSEGVAFCQMVPGATSMQAAAWVGLRLHGVAGAAAAFLGFGLPAFALMLGFALLYQQTGSLPAVAAVFSGLQAVVVAIVANAAISFGRTTLKHWRHALIAALSAGLFWLNLNPLAVIVLAAGLGWLLLSAPPAAAAPVRAAPVRFEPKTLLGILVAAGLGLLGLALFAPDLLRLALLMMKVDLMAFGGGFASVPVMYHEVVEVNGWLAGPVFMNGIVLGQVTPGPIVITATFIGYILGSLPGAGIATISVFLPSFLIVVGVAPFFNRLSGAPLFHRVMRGVLCSFVGLLVATTLRFGLQVHWNLVYALLAGGALAALLRKVDILWVVLGGVILSIVLVR